MGANVAFTPRGALSLLEEPVKGVARIVGIPRRGRSGGLGRRGMSVARYAVAGNGYTGRKQRALVGFVLQCNSHRNGLQALEPRGGFKVRALLAAMQLGVALGARAGEVYAGRQRGGAIKSSCRGHMLHQAR
jgi:hypothetical protein